jgi:hypothetical protein
MISRGTSLQQILPRQQRADIITRCLQAVVGLFFLLAEDDVGQVA